MSTGFTPARLVDVIVIGAGAAGMMCAAEAAKRGRRVVLLDHARNPGEKIRISGGGRCNFTNRYAEPPQPGQLWRFLSENPKFAISALRRFTPADFLKRVRARGIAHHERERGQYFCDGSAIQIVQMLVDDCHQAGVEMRLATAIRELTHADGRFTIRSEYGGWVAPALVLATGGPSIPKMGASGFAYQTAERFGLRIVPPRPALVPFTFAPEVRERMATLAGVSLDAVARIGKIEFAEPMLFTHRGLSGPAILQISSYWREGQAVTLDLAKGRDVADWLRRYERAHPKAMLRTALSALYTERLGPYLAETLQIDGKLAEVSADRVAQALANWSLTPAGTEGYRTAEVTLGGVDTAALNSQTMAARTVPGLYVIGEAVDITGWLGGYNFQWAWASGWVAGQSV